MTRNTLTLQNRELTAYLPARHRPDAPTLLMFPDSPAEADALAALLPDYIALLALPEAHWEHAFTPWRAPKLFAKGADFGGGADETLRQLTEQILLEAERELGLQPQWRGLLGYSLAGLFALYAAYRSDFFQRIASVSGSLWFDGWGDFVATHTPETLPQAVYFSLGDKEAQSRNPRMAAVQTATEAVFTKWQQYACPCTLEINAGGHFDNVPQRLAQAAAWLIKAA